MNHLRPDARELIEKALEHHMKGEFDKAIELYKKSIEVQPSADAYTYMGWAYSMMGEHEKAIELCMKAIAIDPNFGNPYNDIGSYLIALGKLDEAIPWLKRATVAPRYEPRHYPHINLAKIYMAKGMLYDALKEINQALRLAPEYLPAHALRHQVLALLN